MPIPVVLNFKASHPIAVLWHPVAEELKFVDEPIEIFEGTFPPPRLINKLLIVLFKPLVKNEPVTFKDPVIIADPVNGKVDVAFNAKEAVTALEAVPKSEPVRDVAVKDPEISTVFAAKSPFISGVPEPEAMYNLLLSSVNVEGPAANPIAILFEELPENKHPACWPNAILLAPIVLQHFVLLLYC